MNVLLCSWANIFEPEIINVFERTGLNVDTFKVTFDDPFIDRNYIQSLSKQLFLKKYDFVFTVNYLPIVSMTCNIHKINYISWIADSPCPELNSSTLSNSCNHIFIFDKTLFNDYKKNSSANLFYLPLGSNPPRLDEIILTENEFSKYKNDISFVGSLYASRTSYDTITLPNYWHGYFEGIIESQLVIQGYNILNDIISDEAISIYGDAIKQKNPTLLESNELYHADLRSLIINNYIGKECSHRDRIRILDKLSRNFSLALYTNEATDKLPYAHNRGIVEPYEEVFKVYKSSKINLNITSKTIKTGLPLRIFDIMGSGGFLLTNFQSELPDFFEIGKDLVIYEDMDDLLYKTAYYLKHEDERLEIALNGYNKIKNYHQFKTRICKMMEFVFNSSEQC